MLQSEDQPASPAEIQARIEVVRVADAGFAKDLPAEAASAHVLRGGPTGGRIRPRRGAGMPLEGGSVMIDLGWSAPTNRLDAGTALGAILAQHERIRALLSRARAVAEAALDGEPPSPDAVASSIGDIRTTMEVHLAFEEKSLLPILRDDPPLGPERADRLLDEHSRQRQSLSTLHREACAFPNFPILAAKLAFLTEWLLADMMEEERSLLTADVVRDDVIVIDQSSG
jgi:hypothetical protein